jgi:hypothetical protein
MKEMLVVVDFPCGSCGQDVNVTVKCCGQGLVLRSASAAFSVACPGCTVVNEVVFEPAGRVHQVTPEDGFGRYREPSVN